MKDKTLIVGIGHPFRGDDSLGYEAILSIRKQRLPIDVESYLLVGDMTQLFFLFEQYANLYIIDAIITKQNPLGTLLRLEGKEITKFASACTASTHSFNLAQALEMAKTLSILPKKIVIYGIEVMQFQLGEGLSEPVKAQLPLLLHNLLDEILHK